MTGSVAGRRSRVVGDGQGDVGDTFIDGDDALVVEAVEGLVVINGDLTKGAEESLGGWDGEDDGGVQRLHEDTVTEQIGLRTAGETDLVAALELSASAERAERDGHSPGREHRRRDEDESSGGRRSW